MLKIEIPKFDVNYFKWSAFKKSFEEFVHILDISDIRKMVFLQQNLTGSAAGILDRIEPGKENYNDVWKWLVNTYDNKSKLAKITTNSFFQQRDVKENSVYSLRHFYNATEECLVSFKSLGITFENCEEDIVLILLQKLDYRTRELFETRIKCKKEGHFASSIKFKKPLKEKL